MTKELIRKNAIAKDIQKLQVTKENREASYYSPHLSVPFSPMVCGVVIQANRKGIADTAKPPLHTVQHRPEIALHLARKIFTDFSPGSKQRSAEPNQRTRLGFEIPQPHLVLDI